MLSPDVIGLWGSPTSTVDWCEVNYAVSPYVCEFFNTASSLAMVGAGLLGIALHRHVFDRWMLWAFGLLALVGLGSVAFHGTLRFELQLLDELPMLYLVALMAYLLLERGPKPVRGRWLPAALGGYAVLATLSDAFLRGQIQFFAFQLSFGALEFYCLWRIYQVSREAENSAVRHLFRLGVVVYLGAIGIWFVDLEFCSLVSGGLGIGLPNPQLHAWWHVLVSVGFYLLLLVVGFDRLRLRGRRPRLAYVGRLVPKLVCGA